jgi:ion channel-forming bestrophin family protein
MVLSLGVAAYSGLAVWKEQGRFANYADLPSGLEAAISLVIGLLLAFRANRAFDRWWEARTLWGTLVNACRNLAVKTNNVVIKRDESFERFCGLLCVFPNVLRDHLREGADLTGIEGLSDDNSNCQHPPSRIVNQMYGILETWKQEQRIHYGEFRMLDRELKVFLEVCGGCERIRNTPIAASYRVFLNHAIAVFLLTLPWGIVNEFGGLTIPIVFLTSYFIIAAEGIAEHIEQPFGGEGDGLNLDTICEAINSSVDEIFATPTADCQLTKRSTGAAVEREN